MFLNEKDSVLADSIGANGQKRTINMRNFNSRVRQAQRAADPTLRPTQAASVWVGRRLKGD